MARWKGPDGLVHETDVLLVQERHLQRVYVLGSYGPAGHMLIGPSSSRYTNCAAFCVAQLEEKDMPRCDEDVNCMACIASGEKPQ